MARVVIIGPSASRAHNFEIHAEGCAHLNRLSKRQRQQHGDQPWTAEASTRRDVVVTIYEPGCFDYNPENPDELAQYEGDVHFAPCCPLPQGS